MLSLHHLRFLFVGLSILLAGNIVWSLSAGRRGNPTAIMARTILIPESPPTTVPTGSLASAASYVALLDQAPEYRSFKERFADQFPGDWTRTLEHLEARTADGKVPASADSVFLEALKALRRSRGALAAKAGPEALGRIFDIQAQMLAGLSTADKRLCVDYLYGEESSGFLSFAASHRQLLAVSAGVALDAIIDGSAHRIDRPAPTDDDFALLEKELTRHGLAGAEIEALLDGRHPDPPITDNRLCEAGQIYLDVLRQLPEAPRLRIYALSAEVMSRF